MAITTDKPGSFSLKGNLDMHTVRACWPERDQEINRLKGESLSVNFANVEHVDTSGLAWLIHLVKACHAEQVTLSLFHVPAGLINLAKLSNVEDLLPLQ